ncbi:MAG TPA: DUF4412 domain-containing protein [Bacillota bacterium]|nr:DUF4412 domain-containing protein [Bacillota bacterium]HOL09171.1 DUF4412 domain-containing protein [Bacillota bacterium]HPO96846.1 DUF4412 domain-containing protein [Bacillota bacterium]
MRKVIYYLMVLILVLSLVGMTSAMDNVEYNAVYLLTNGKETLTQKLYFSNDKMRMEMDGKKGEKISMIVRVDKNVTWILMDEQKMYMEQKVDPEMVKQYAKQFEGYETKLTKIGSEKLLGYDCDIYENVEGKNKYKYWLVKNKNAVLRSILFENGKEKLRIEAKEINFRKQADSLFEIPDGYQKFAFNLKIPKQ